jgi:hypothetical protein
MANTQPYTYNQVIKLLSDLASNHYQINSFGNGDLWETMESNQAAHKKFPLMWVSPISSTIDFPFNTIRLGIAVMDLVNTDESNENEVLSDTLLILQDFKAQLSDPTYSNTFITSKSATLTPFTERFTARATGWAMELDIRIKWEGDRCAIPMSGAPVINNYCAPVTILDSMGGVITTVPSGGTYTDSNTCNDATVENSDQTYQTTVASGATLVLADTTYNFKINGILQTTTVQPSMVDYTFNVSFI